MVIADLALRIDEIMRGPVLVVEGFPDGVVAIDGYGISNLQIGYGLGNVGRIFLECEFRGEYANYNEAVGLVFFRPGFDVRNRTQAIDAGISPEICHDYFAFELRAG